MSDIQIGAVADLLSFMLDAEALCSALLNWLRDAGVPGGKGEYWLTTAAGREMAARAEAMRDDRLMEVRRIWSADDLRRLFAIGDDEARRLELQYLVSERVRSELRRRAEGVRPAAEARADRAAKAREQKPWEVAGIPRSTYYERLKRAPVVAVQTALAGAGEPDQKPWVALGISERTYYRRKAGGEVGSGIRNRADPIPMDVRIPDVDDDVGEEDFTSEYPALDDYIGHIVSKNTSYDRVGPNPDSTATPDWAKRTSEARRLSVVAARLGMNWSGSTSSDPATWYASARSFDTDDQTEYAAAVAAAQRAAERNKAVSIARARRAGGDQVDDPDRPFLALLDTTTDALPAEFLPDEAWEAVPAEFRIPAKLDAARYHVLHGVPVSDAIFVAIETLCREQAVMRRILDAGPPIVPVTELIAGIIPGRLGQDWYGVMGIAADATVFGASLALYRVLKTVAARAELVEKVQQVRSTLEAKMARRDRRIEANVLDRMALILVGSPRKPIDSALEQARFDIRFEVAEDDRRRERRHIETRGAHLLALL